MLELKTAAELVDAEAEARWARRRAARQGEVFRRVLDAFVEDGGPVDVEALVGAFPGRPAGEVRAALAALDAEDLVQVEDGRVVVAYPFAARPTAFVVVLDHGRERYTCCAVDALGIAPMLGRPVEVRAACHATGAPLRFPVGPDGPGPEAAGVVVWIGRPDTGRLLTSL